MIGGLIPLLLIGGLIAGAVALAKRVGSAPKSGGLRRVVVAVFLLATGIIAATGVAQLLTLVIDSGDFLTSRGASDVAQAIALATVGLPVFALLWRHQMRLLEGPDRNTLAWPIYLAGATAVYGIGTVIGLAVGITWLFGWNDTGVDSLSIGIAWGAMWAWHEWHRVSIRRPDRLPELAPSVGSAIGLVTAAVGAIQVLIALLEPAYDVVAGLSSIGPGMTETIGEGAVSLVIGTGVWWWQWVREVRRTEPTVSRSVYLLVPGAAGGAITGLVALGAGLFTVLEFLFESVGSVGLHFEDLPNMIAAGAIGFLVWRYHRNVVLERPEVLDTDVGYAYRYILSGVGLIAAASGFGVVLNGLLSSATPAVAGEGGVDILLGGISALAVGAPVWWLSWKPRETPAEDELTSPARRTYLTVLAGVGGVTALISLILFLFRIIESLLEGDSFATMVDRFRAPFGVLVATGLVAWYHIATWRSERRLLPEEEHVAIHRLTVVTPHLENGLGELGKTLGVPVITKHSAGSGRVVAEEGLADYLRTLDADEAVLIEEDGGYRVIRVTED